MKPFVVFLFACSFMSFSQENCFFLNENFTGRCESFYPDGKTKIKAEMQDGMRNGLVEMFYPDGMKRASGTFEKDSLLSSTSYIFHVNKRLKWKIEFDGTGTKVFLFSIDGILQQEGNMSNTQLPVGEWIFYDEDGNELKRVNMDDVNADKSSWLTPPKPAKFPEFKAYEPD